LMPNPAVRQRLWRSDGAFVMSVQRRLPKNAMVFELPVVDFPDHSVIQRLSAYDLIKEGYLHSTTLRWSAGGVRGRDGEWQFPASQLPTRDLVRGVVAIGFSALTLNRDGYPDNGSSEVAQLDALLGAPIVTSDHRLIAWDLRGVAPSLLHGMSGRARRALAQQMLDAPRVYLSSDIDPLRNRGESLDICARGQAILVNPGHQSVRETLELTFRQRQLAATLGQVTVNGRPASASTDRHGTGVTIDLRPGTTDVGIAVKTGGVRCQSTPMNGLPTISASFRSNS